MNVIFNGNFMNKFFASIDAKRDAKIELRNIFE